MPTRIITALILLLSTAWALADSPPSSPALADGAPDRYAVVQGDTLWGIAGKFLKEPWRWHEIWRANRGDVVSPHRIYPGQVLLLDKSGASPVLRPANLLASGGSSAGGVVKLAPSVHVEASTKPIPSIPPGVIEPFLSEPQVVEAGELDNAPHIIATEEDRVYLGLDDKAYVTGLKDEKVRLWQVFRPAKPVADPSTGEVLGYQAFYLGTMSLDKPGEPATMRVMSNKREIGLGDLLMPANSADVPVYAPHAPATQVEGRVAAIYDGVGEAGRNSIVTLNLGTEQGIEVGHVLAIYRAGQLALYKGPTGTLKAKEYALPPERFGLMFVFRVFKHLSYALVMNTTRPVNVGDRVSTP